MCDIYELLFLKEYLFSLQTGNTEPTNKPGILDPNVYATKKTIAQGLLDVALLTANASQLKYLLQVGPEHEFYYVMMTLISLSIILQVLFTITMDSYIIFMLCM